MSDAEAQFLIRLRATFQQEAAEHLRALVALLPVLQFPPSPDQQIVISTLFREAHSLKGAARVVEEAQIELHCQTIERALGDVLRGNTPFSPNTLALVQDSISALVAEIGSPKEGHNA